MKRYLSKISISLMTLRLAGRAAREKLKVAIK